GRVLSRIEFEKQARLVGLQLETVGEAYRYDNRSPEQLKADGGFLPNPNKPALSLVEHTEKHSTGSGNFVSTTLKEDNFHIASDAFFSRTPLTDISVLPDNPTSPTNLKGMLRVNR